MTKDLETAAGTGGEAMQAGRELDALIAEKVLGIEVFHPLQSMPGYLAVMTKELGAVPLPRFSTDIMAAWSVVEKMRERSWALELRNIHKWDAVFGLRSTSRSRVHAEDCESAPLAICLAALKAVASLPVPASPSTEKADVGTGSTQT